MKVTTIALVLFICGCAVARGHFHDGRRYNLPVFPKQELYLDPSIQYVKEAKAAKNMHCPIDGLPIGSKPIPVNVVYKGVAIQLESAACKPEFARRPGIYIGIAVADTVNSDTSGVEN